jgi:hypothetical protein
VIINRRIMGRTKRKEDRVEMEEKIRELEARISKKRRKLAKMTDMSVTPSQPLPCQPQHEDRSHTPELTAEQWTAEATSEPESEPAAIEPQPGCSYLESPATGLQPECSNSESGWLF